MLFDWHQRIAGANAFPGTHWAWVTLVSPTQEADSYSQSSRRSISDNMLEMFSSDNAAGDTARPGRIGR